MREIPTLRNFAEVVRTVKKRDYYYQWRPQYLEGLAEGPRCCSCAGVPASEGADFIMKGYVVKMNREKCNKCGVCWMYCPLGVIRETEDGYFEIDHEFCRPCGICAHECPSKAIEFKEV